MENEEDEKRRSVQRLFLIAITLCILAPFFTIAAGDASAAANDACSYLSADFPSRNKLHIFHLYPPQFQTVQPFVF